MLIGRVDACNTRFFSQHQDPVRCSFTWVAWAYNHADTIDMHGVTCVQFGLSLTMIRFLYDLTMRLAAHRWALPLLAVISFLESSVFPIPPDVMLIPMVLAQPRRAFLIAGICLLASVLGGLLGYIVGALAFDQFGAPILQFFGQEHAADEFIKTYNQYGAWAVLFAGLTPFPYKIITILSGATGLSLLVFVVSSVIARGIRFYLIAILLWRYGGSIKPLIEKHLGLVFTLTLVLLGTIYLLVKIL